MKNKYKHTDIEYVLKVLNSPELSLSKEFKDWIKDNTHYELYKELRQYREAGLAAYKYHKPDISDEWHKFIHKKTHRKLIPIWASVAASVIILLSVTFLLQFYNSSQKNNNNISYNFSAKPQNAVLIVSGGKEIKLGNEPTQLLKGKNGKNIVADSNKMIKYLSHNFDSAYTEFHTLKIPKGGEYKLVLSDGTKVWLNSESELKYPVIFNETQRLVKLKGEAYFEVKHAQEKPFIVETHKVTTKVLGTRFNVNAYSDYDVNITLIKGSVSLNNKLNKSQNNILLKPGENANLSNSSKVIDISKVNTDKYIAWKEGYFHFDEERLEDIFIKLERWYDFQVFYQNPAVKDYEFKIRAYRHAPFSEILKIFEETNRISIRLKGKTIIISDVERRTNK